MWQKYQQLITLGHGNKSAVIKGRQYKRKRSGGGGMNQV